MTGEHWRTCLDPRTMLESLRGRATERQLRLFVAGCCRRVIHTFTEEDDLGRVECIDVAERYADGLASEDEREDSFAEATDGEPLRLWDLCTNLAVADFRQESPEDADAIDCAIGAAEEARLDAVNGNYDDSDAIDAAEAAAQAVLIRCIFGDPFAPFAVDPDWLTWNDGTVARLAEEAYRNRSLPDGLLDAQLLAVLADALEDAGCGDVLALSHLRGGPHIRGCYVLDRLIRCDQR